MSRLKRKPSEVPALTNPARFERFGLRENPFPAVPAVNRESSDPRINGNIYEVAIRHNEHSQVVERFLKQPQANPMHLRLGYLIDTSYIGRGNGKSAFLINLQSEINRDYCLEFSNGKNKCFAVYVAPEAGGRTKTFPLFVEAICRSIFASGVIQESLAALRLDAISKLYPQFRGLEGVDDATVVAALNSTEWFKKFDLNIESIEAEVRKVDLLQALPEEFPLFQRASLLAQPLPSCRDFEMYFAQLRKPQERIEFLFSHLVRFFTASGFNGGYVLVDDFERIPDFQGIRQKRDFAVELRTCLFDGISLNARTGFFNFLLVLHAGVQRLIADAWSESGLETRAPVTAKEASANVVPFEKLNSNHAKLLLTTYLDAYRLRDSDKTQTKPFSARAIEEIGRRSEYNAAKILRFAYHLLERAADAPELDEIDGAFVQSHEADSGDKAKDLPSIERAETTDLLRKIRQKED